jgi:hypothetical protein
MFVSSNPHLISFLSQQLEHPNQKAGTNALFSLFVQLFAFSDPGYPDEAKLGKCRPIFHSQTKLESLTTRVLFENILLTSTAASVLHKIFQFAFSMIEKVLLQTPSRSGNVDRTSSELNLEHAMYALVNISLSFRWCSESNITPNPYFGTQPCFGCQLNSLTVELIRKLSPMRKKLSKLLSFEKFRAHTTQFFSNWWYRMERPSLCACDAPFKVSGVDDMTRILKNVKSILSSPFPYLSVHSLSSIHPSLQQSLDGVSAPNSPIASPHISCAPTPRSPAPFALDALQCPPQPSAVHPMVQVTSEAGAGMRWSNTRMSSPLEGKKACTPRSPQFTCCQKILNSLNQQKLGQHLADADCE